MVEETRSIVERLAVLETEIKADREASKAIREKLDDVSDTIGALSAQVHEAIGARSMSDKIGQFVMMIVAAIAGAIASGFANLPHIKSP